MPQVLRREYEGKISISEIKCEHCTTIDMHVKHRRVPTSNTDAIYAF